jgi:Ala-tRNA(Pro) deacylase
MARAALLKLLRVDTRLQQVGTLWFNAGALDKSIALAVEDYFRTRVKP